MKKILPVILIIAVIGGVIGYMMWNKPHKDMHDTKAEITVEAATLLSEFVADEAGANEKYLGKTLAVTGSVAEVSKNDDGTVSLMLDAGDPLNFVKCNFDKLAQHKRKEFQNGEKVTIKGDCSGFIEMTGVVLDRCVEQ